MEERLKSRAVHVIMLLIITIISLSVYFTWPDLTTKPTDVMAFLGFWVTVFGLCVAIVEIIRLGYTSKSLVKASESSFNNLKLQMELQDVKSCLEIINISIVDLKNNKQIPMVLISRIKQIYISVFSKEYNIETSEHRKNILIINSYVHVSSTRRNSKAANEYDFDMTGDNEKPHKHKATLDILNKIHDELLGYAASKAEYKKVNP